MESDNHIVYRMLLFEYALVLIIFSALVGFFKRINPIFGFISSLGNVLAGCLFVAAIVLSLVF